jgi:hypothetical protein
VLDSNFNIEWSYNVKNLRASTNNGLLINRDTIKWFDKNIIIQCRYIKNRLYLSTQNGFFNYDPKTNSKPVKITQLSPKYIQFESNYIYTYRNDFISIININTQKECFRLFSKELENPDDITNLIVGKEEIYFTTKKHIYQIDKNGLVNNLYSPTKPNIYINNCAIDSLKNPIRCS